MENNRKNSINYNGSNYEELKAKFMEFFDVSCLQEILNIIDESKENFFDSEEFFEIRYSEQEGDMNFGYKKLIPKTRYHVNLKNISILCLQVVGEMILQAKRKNGKFNEQDFPIISTLIELKNCFSKLREDTGELCIAKEIATKNKDFEGWNSFINIRRECVNNHLECSYNQDGKCKLTEKDFEKIVKLLENKNILYQKNNIYKITF